MKQCNKCKQTKELTEFYKDKSRKDGLQHICKDCRITYSTKYREKNSEKLSIISKKYYKNNKDKRNVYSRQYSEKNKERLKKYYKEYALKNREREVINSPDFKTCSKCKQNLSKENFHKARSYLDGLANYCKKCTSFCRKQNRYDIELEQYNNLLIQQDNKCLICFKSFNEIAAHNIHIDHCHITGKIRSLLCNNCNSGIGQFNDNIEVLKNAIKYLERFKI